MLDSEDTICQIITAPGVGGVGIVRLSGARAHAIGRQLCRRAGAKNSTETSDLSNERRMRLRHAYDAAGETIDHGLYVEFVGPRSFTGEDTAEFQAHGGVAGLTRLMNRCSQLGARAALPGEFSLRAVQNGRMSLLEAESIAAAIGAQTEAAHRVALRQIGSELATEIQALRAQVVHVSTAINVELEFPDEHLGGDEEYELEPGHAAYGRQALARSLVLATQACRALVQRAESGRILNHGAVVALVGPPNVGKSSLLNALLGFDRALVSPLAGTTRDSVEERLQIAEFAVRLVDTAGLREAADAIESAGIERTQKVMSGADLVIDVTSTDHLGHDALSHSSQSQTAARSLRVVNKSDLSLSALNAAEITGTGAREGAAGVSAPLRVSARTGEGIDDLKQAIADALRASADLGRQALVCSQRHVDLLSRTLQALERAQASFSLGVGSELVAVDLVIATNALSEFLGENMSEEIRRSIFANFCIGK